MKRTAFVFTLSVLTGCMTTQPEDAATRARPDGAEVRAVAPQALSRSPGSIQRSNSNITSDFLSLHFELESGRQLPVLTRFEGPVTVRMTGRPVSTLQRDLTALLGRLRNEADISISQIGTGRASITIESVPRSEIQRSLPGAACFIAPGVSSLSEYRKSRGISWASLTRREKVAIVIPADAGPQEARDCLHEELAQALGPLNDLYRLPDSVFNDDNVHSVLTGFDMLVLRATYAPELRSGMTRTEVAARLPALLARLNPAGVQVAPHAFTETPRDWINAIKSALGPDASHSSRVLAANRALSHFTIGRMAQMSDPAAAQQHYALALTYLSSSPYTALHRAFITSQTAAFAIANGDGAGALQQIEPVLGVAQRAENAALLATLMLLKAEALELTGQPGQARAVRLDSLGWARYGFGSEQAVRARMNEISSLNPRNRRNG